MLPRAMWRLSQPTADDVRVFLASQRLRPFTYPDAGSTRDGTHEPPPGFVRDHNRQRLGAGDTAFAAARAALRDWQMFPLPLARIAPPGIPIAQDEIVGVVIRTFGLWWLNAARIVYVIDEPRRFGFAYGTLPDHAERGEERFLVEQLADGSVWYDLTAFSRPRHWLARLGAPVARALQRRFARMSKAAMLRAVTSPAPV